MIPNPDTPDMPEPLCEPYCLLDETPMPDTGTHGVNQHKLMEEATWVRLLNKAGQRSDIRHHDTGDIHSPAQIFLV